MHKNFILDLCKMTIDKQLIIWYNLITTKEVHSMSYYNVYIYIKGFGFDTYTVGANNTEQAKKVAKQRVLEETSMTENDFEVCDTLKLDAI